MFVLDTDTLSLLVLGHEWLSERARTAAEEVVMTVISRIEILQGRFGSVRKAADGRSCCSLRSGSAGRRPSSAA